MSANTETDMATTAAERVFRLPDAVVSEDFSREELAEDRAGMELRFQRVKIPSGGTLQFEIPGEDPDNPEYQRYIEGVILHSNNANAYWPGGENDDENTPPECSSNDGIQGVGDPGGYCEGCGFNQYGTAENGKGKACSATRS